jgi:putative ABC transport system substrate-binding protein
MGVELAPKRLELLRDLVPTIRRVGILTNPANPTASIDQYNQQVAAVAAQGIEVHQIPVSNDRDLELGFETFATQRLEALDVSDEPFHVSRRERIIALAAAKRIPTVYGNSLYARAGGLMSYGPNIATAYVLAGKYVGRILKGEKPSDLPVAQPSTFEFVINLKTAKALGLEFPPIIAARATEVIE